MSTINDLVSFMDKNSNASAVVPVPEGHLLLVGAVGDRNLSMVRLYPLDGSEPQDVAAFASGGASAESMLTVALAALESWK